MAGGKFSKPRNHFSEESVVTKPSGKFAKSSAPVRQSPSVYDSEERAIEEAFLEVTESDDFGSGSNLPPFVEKALDFISRNKKMMLISSCAVVLVILIAVIGIVLFSGASDPYDGRILNNVTIAGVNVGGMTRSEAEDAIKAVTENTFTKQDMVVELPDTILRFSPEDTNAKLDVKAVVKAAYSYGRTGSDSQRQNDYQNSLTGNHTIGLAPYLGLDTDYIQTVLVQYASQFADSFKETTYEMQGQMPSLEPETFDENAACQTLVITIGTPGFGLDVEALYNDILDAYSFNQFSVVVEEISAEKEPEPLDLEAVYEEFYIAPINASLDMQTFEPIPGVYGYGFDMEQAQKLLDEADYGETVEVPMMFIEPEISDDNVMYRDVLGECVTPHTDNENRNTNLRLACEALDGVVINPGETFSYNDTLGERTEAKGYKPAPAYSGYNLVDSIGGGVCQGSSTLYLATLLADMEIIDRVNHGYPSSYIELGMDATVNWGTTDFQFRNNWNFPIMIKAWVADGNVNIQILGTDERDYYIKMEHEVIGNPGPDTEYVEKPAGSGYYDGQVIRVGSAGSYVKSYRCKYDKETNELISRDFEAYSSYQPVNILVVRIVGGETPPPATTPPADSGGGGGSTPPPADSGGGGGSTPPPADSGGGGGSTPPPADSGGGGSTPPPADSGGGGETT